MQRVSRVKVGGNQTITLPAKITDQSVAELAIERAGDVITLKLVRLSTESFWDRPKAEPEFLEMVIRGLLLVAGRICEGFSPASANGSD